MENSEFLNIHSKFLQKNTRGPFSIRQSGTPDLRDKFVIGATTKNIFQNSIVYFNDNNSNNEN